MTLAGSYAATSYAGQMLTAEETDPQPTPGTRLRVYDAADPSVLRGTLDQPYGIKWARERLDVGVGEFTIPHDSPVVQADPAILERDNIVVNEVDGQAEHAWLIRKRRRQRGNVWDPVSVRGPGALELLRHALVFQRGGCVDASESDYVDSDKRVFGWQHTDFDDSGWGEVGSDMTGGPLSTLGWPDPQAVAFEPIFPGERSLYRRLLEAVPGAAGSARMALAATVNTEVTVWLDGEEVLTKEKGERGVQHADVPYRECDMQLAVHVEGDDPHPGRWGWTWMRLVEPADPDEEPSYGDALRRTYDPATFPDATPWLSYEGDGLDYPGVSPGFILVRLFDEAKARGFIDAVSRDFDDVYDSAGREWPTNQDGIEFACQVGDDSVLDVAERLRDHGVDVALGPDPYLTFQAWQGRGVDRGVGSPTPVRFTLDMARDADIETEDETINTVLARTQHDWIERPQPSPTSNRREGFLKLGMTPSADGGAEISDDVLDDFNDPRVSAQFTVTSSQNPPRPTVDYDLGDIVIAPRVDPDDFVGDWREDDLRVDTIGAVVDEVGDVDWVHDNSPPKEGS